MNGLDSKCGRVLATTFLAALVLSQTANAQIQVPQPTPYANDANTVLLEHFDGSTSGTTIGSVSYDTGVYGEGIRLTNTSSVYWNIGALPQGTVEFWAKLDNMTTSATDPGAIADGVGFVSANYAANPVALTMTIHVANNNSGVTSNEPWGQVNIAPFNWSTVGTSVQIATNQWYQYAMTWGAQGIDFYVDGVLAASNSVNTTMNPLTGQWAIGAELRRGNDGFNGVMDELRISNIQRTFTAVPEPSTISLVAGAFGCLLALRRRDQRQGKQH